MLQKQRLYSHTVCAACLNLTRNRDTSEVLGFLCWDCGIDVENSLVKSPIAVRVTNSLNRAQSKLIVINAIFFYTNTIRKIILNAKIRKNNWAINFLSYFFCRSFGDWYGQDNIEYLLPFPSSVPGRFLGELDLAWVMAYAIHKQNHIRLRSYPARLYWRFSKEAQKKKHLRQRLSPNIDLKDVGLSEIASHDKTHEPRGVMIDDIITSGSTLERCLRGSYDNNLSDLCVLACALPQI